MNCNEIKEYLELLAASECDPQIRLSVENHISTCETCTKEYKELQKLQMILEYDYRKQLVIKNITDMLDSKKQKRWLVPLSTAIAASILAVILIWQLVAPDTTKVEKPKLTAKWIQKKLGDGTTVWATSDAKFEENDGLFLNSGEIYINSDKPFLVKTPAALATAKGQSFIKILLEDKMKPTKLAVTILVLSGLVQLENSYGTISGSTSEVLYAQDNEAPKKHVENLALKFAKYYEPVKVKIDPQIPSYDLPLDTKKIINFNDAVKKLALSEDAVEKLKTNGFVVLPGHFSNTDILKPYHDLDKRKVPLFITTDTLLHVYHILFSETLKEIEEKEFVKDITSLCTVLVEKLEKLEIKDANDDMKEAQKKALTFFSIALKLVNSDAKIPDSASNDTDEVLDKIEKHEGFWPQPDKDQAQWPLFNYSEDFSQYVPRGHYAENKMLEKYFKAMMWLGRMTFIIKGGEPYGRMDQPFLVDSKESNQQTIAASIITKLLDETELTDKRKAKDVYERIYTVTSFFVGLADDLGPQEYKGAIVQVCGKAMDIATLADDKKMEEFKLELAKHNPPAIYSGTSRQGTFRPDAGPEKLFEILDKSAGFRFMGQRFTPDSYMMNKLVYPTIGEYNGADPSKTFTAVKTPLGVKRCFPRGLDVMTVLGSKHAREIIKELGDDTYADYDNVLDDLIKEFGKLSNADWNRNLYWSWLYSLKPLVEEHGKGYQTFMTTNEWHKKSLTTALASWSQLRHDTMLYAKESYQSVTQCIVDETMNYLEPVPEFYGRVLSLVKMTRKGLQDMKLLPEKKNEYSKNNWEILEKFTETLVRISENEIANKKLGKDARFLELFADETFDNLLSSICDHTKHKSTLIASVHTDQNSKKALKEGTGSFGLVVACYKLPSGNMYLGAGPTLSYYEFKYPMQDRLTDQSWEELLKSENAPDLPQWTKGYTSDNTTYKPELKDGRKEKQKEND